MISRTTIFAAAFVLLPAAAFAEPMTAASIQSEIIGKQLCVSGTLGNICVRHSAGGSSAADAGILGKDTGSWKLNGDRLCVTWKKIEDGRTLCSVFSKTNGVYSYVQDGKTQTFTVR